MESGELQMVMTSRQYHLDFDKNQLGVMFNVLINDLNTMHSLD